jgi:hypothetical protein
VGKKPAAPGASPRCGSKPQTIRRSDTAEQPADWEIGDTAGWETCGAVVEPAAARSRWPQADHKFTPDWEKRPLLSNGKWWFMKKIIYWTVWGRRLACKCLI